jgi:hypothetical protein
VPPEATQGGVLLDDVVRFIHRFVVLTEAQAVTLALWVAHTHAFEAAETTPYIWITSALKRSGKSLLLLKVLRPLVHEPKAAASLTEAVLYRMIEELKPTLLIDEVDAIFGKGRERDDLRGILNAGFERGALAYRMGGARMDKLQDFAVFCPKALAGIGKALPDTITDRAIRIRLERRTREEPIERFVRREVVPEAEELRERVADWVLPQLEELHRIRPGLVDEIDDRANDVWEPLFAIADLAGGDWPEKARGSARILSGEEEREDESRPALLLKDIFTVFSNGVADRLRTNDLIDHLADIEESPWGDWHGKKISAQALSRLLQPFLIKTMTIKVDGEPVRGYKREQFTDAFHRVLGVTGVTPGLQSQNEVTPGNALNSEGVTSRPAWEAEGNAGNAGNAQGTGERPLPDDEGGGGAEALVLAEVEELVAEGVLLEVVAEARCHICLAETDLSFGDERWWCTDFAGCNARARRRLLGVA